MSPSLPPAAAPVLQGWRARAWAWVLFVALFKGLVPHAALAGVLMQGDPALVWCAPGQASGSAESRTSDGMSAAAHVCLCASAGEGATPVDPADALPREATPDGVVPLPQAILVAQGLLMPPARGPPTL